MELSGAVLTFIYCIFFKGKKVAFVRLSLDDIIGICFYVYAVPQSSHAMRH